MNNFWNKRTQQVGPLFGKKSGVTATPQSLSGTVSTSKSGLTGSTTRQPAAKADSVVGSSPMVRMKFDHDIACGVFVGAFDVPAWVVSLEVIELTDPQTGRVERYDNWLRPNDMLAILTKEFGRARQKASAVVIKPDAPPALRAQQMKERDEWNRRVTEMRDQVVCLLQTRHVYVRVKELGVKELIPAP